MAINIPAIAGIVSKMSSSICDIEKLAELFNSASAADQLDDDDDEAKESSNDIQCDKPNNEETKTAKKQNPYAKIEPPKPRREVLDPEADDADELYFDETSQDAAGQRDWKKTPKWDISYKQSVSASDVFLGMGFKTPSTNSCENMVVTVELPGENRQNIDLKIEKDALNLTSPKFFLDLKLPHPVDPKRGNAQFDKDGSKLIVTLLMDRELDLLNF